MIAPLLGACSTQAPVGSEAGSKVTVSVAFPQRQSAPGSITPQGVPASAERATVTIYNQQGQLVNSLNLTRHNSSGSLLLANGSYDFEVSVQSHQGIEVAWARQSHTITMSTTIFLKPKAMLGQAGFLHIPSSILGRGESRNLLLYVLEPGLEEVDPSLLPYHAFVFPLEDYEVDYTIGSCAQPDCSDFTPSNAATIVASSKMGVRIKAGQVQESQTIRVRAVVSGLGTNRQPISLVRFSQPIEIVNENNVGVTLDMIPPWVWIWSRMGNRVNVGQTAYFEGYASDDETLLRNLKVFVNHQEVNPSVNTYLPAPNASFTFSFTPDQPGRYDIEIVAFDEAGNSYRYTTYLDAQ